MWPHLAQATTRHSAPEAIELQSSELIVVINRGASQKALKSASMNPFGIRIKDRERGVADKLAFSKNTEGNAMNPKLSLSGVQRRLTLRLWLPARMATGPH